MTHERFKEIVGALQKHIGRSRFKGHVFCVGGCVRDLVMGKEIKDIDLVVDLPDGGINLAAFLSNKGVLKHTPITYPTYGTAMFKLNEFPDEELEAVQTRKEQYKDKKSRNPETEYGSLREDAFRRDLTINALYYDISNGKITDPTGMGMEDIKIKLIRTTSKPEVIFNDDPLRILRCLRFASRFGKGWHISKETMVGIGKTATRLNIITRERIQNELNNILLSPTPEKAFIPIIMYGIDRIIFKTEFNTRVVKWNEVNRIYAASKPTARIPSVISPLELGLCIILITVDAGLRKDILKELRYSNEIINNVILTLDIADKIIKQEIKEEIPSLRKAQYTYGRILEDAVYVADLYERACFHNNGTFNTTFFLASCKTLHDNGLEMYDYKLPVCGYDIMQTLNIPAGKEVGDKLDELIDIAAECPNITKEELLRKLKHKNKK